MSRRQGVNMAKNMKPYEVPLDATLAKEILNTPLPPGDNPEPPQTIGERLSQARQAVEDANEYLAQSMLAKVVASSLMRQLKKRGVPAIQVRPDGVVVLQVSYKEKPTTTVSPLVTRARHKTTLPSLADLRERAEGVGVDITDLGRQKRAILERIEAAEAAAAEEKKPRKTILRRKTTSAPDMDIGQILDEAGDG